MTIVPVTFVTQHATADSLSDADYRDIYEELRNVAGSLDKFVALTGSRYSKALWAKYHNGEASLNRTQRSELRVAVGLAALPYTVEEAAGTADPDALVVRIGDDKPHSIIMVATRKELEISVNGAITAKETQGAPIARVTSVTRRHRKHYVRPVATEAQEERRAATGVSWREVIEAGLTAVEA